jgi:myosin heavy subunit
MSLLIAMQIQYNITRLEEWCKANNLSEGTLSMESLMQATKLLQLKKVIVSSLTTVPARKAHRDPYKQATPADIDILFDVCWILSPTQIQKLISQYHVAEYEVSGHRLSAKWGSSLNMISTLKDADRARDSEAGSSSYQRE